MTVNGGVLTQKLVLRHGQLMNLTSVTKNQLPARRTERV